MKRSPVSDVVAGVSRVSSVEALEVYHVSHGCCKYMIADCSLTGWRGKSRKY